MIQKITWVLGIVFILIGALGFVPMFASGGLLFGVFSVDTANNLVYLVSGVLAILAAWGTGAFARRYCKVFGILYAIITVIGLIQGDTVMGLMVVNSADNVLHLVIAVLALWAGFGAKVELSAQPGMAV